MSEVKIYFDILTLFPNFFDSPLSTSLLSKAIKKDLVNIRVHDIRRFGIGKHKQVDDRPFGGGAGMVLKPDVLAKSLKAAMRLRKEERPSLRPRVILLEASGKTFTQQKATVLSHKEWIILVCGHYEGVDERFKELLVDEEISIGDYVLSGGETAAIVIIDSVTRLVPGFLSKPDSLVHESFTPTQQEGEEIKLLDYPVYTRPEKFQKKEVPKVLLSGDHKGIKKWRSDQALKKTQQLRPDLLEAS
ncbi:MAG: tRNA (guanosine(37)-N1)-methyltransferase TrmD [Candidatus Woykebacteria bacterium]